MHLSMLGRLALLLASALVLALPAPKDAKFFDPLDDPNVTDLGKHTGKIGIDIVDPSPLRVDPVRVFDNIARSLGTKTSSLAKRGGDGGGGGDAAVLEKREEREGKEGEEGGAVVGSARVRVDPVEVAAPAARPSPIPVMARAGRPQDTGPSGEMPKFRSSYDTGEWVRHY
ncbi:hypothetical protein LX36DRAFT_708395 [Colletotrichum falcatum]|nr:hypothetical protein LX36DRAFT_708395 [Colletotrichum falcatum]